MRTLYAAYTVVLSSLLLAAPALAQVPAPVQPSSCPPGSLTCAPAPGPLPGPPQPGPMPPAPPSDAPSLPRAMPQRPLPQSEQYYAPRPAIVHSQPGAPGGSQYSAVSYAAPAPSYNAPMPPTRSEREGVFLGAEGLGAFDLSAKPASAVGGAGLKLGYRAHDVAVNLGVAGSYSQVSGVDRFQSDWTVAASAYLDRSQPSALRPYLGGALGFAVVQENAGRFQSATTPYNLLRLHFGYEWRMAAAVAMQFEARGQFLGAVDRDDAYAQGLPRSSAQLFGVLGLVLYPVQ